MDLFYNGKIFSRFCRRFGFKHVSYGLIDDLDFSTIHMVEISNELKEEIAKLNNKYLVINMEYLLKNGKCNQDW